uniref:DNA repair protein RecO n=1 Tax=candidate division WOR-3 bacterium TaxID=2052148 RepID=A0A7V3PUW5_UNCW3
MPEPITTEAVCLRSRNWRESSCVLTMFTREIGLVSVIAKGARRPKSRLGGAANLFSHTRVLLYPPRSGELYLITEAEIINLFPGLLVNYEHLLAASRLAEFLMHTLPPRHPEERLFQLLLVYLNELSQPATPALTRVTTQTLILSFILKALTFLGYRPELHRCSRCQQELVPPVIFDRQLGALVCSRCASGSSPTEKLLSTDHLFFLRKLLHTPATELSQHLPENESLSQNQEIITTVLCFIQHHYPTQKFLLFDTQA